MELFTYLSPFGFITRMKVRLLGKKFSYTEEGVTIEGYRYKDCNYFTLIK